MLKRKSTYTLIALLFGLLFFYKQVHAQNNGHNIVDKEYKLKAAYTYRFTRYIQWKEEEKKDTFYIGVLGKSRIQGFLTKIAQNRSIKDKPVKIYTYNRTDDFNSDHMPQIDKCDILFVPKKQIKSRDNLTELTKRNILVIGETDDFIKNGGLISFVVKRNKLHFKINHSDLIDCGFTISPKLLKLAILENTKRKHY